MSGKHTRGRKGVNRARRPTAQKLKDRKTTITNAFVLSILPIIDSTDEEYFSALRVLNQDPDSLTCVYCGSPTHGWDHLHAIVEDSMPTGYITEIANLVPACGRCNSSKGGQNWEDWMRSTTASGSPTSRGVADVDDRIARLKRFELWRKPIWIDFKSLIGEAEWTSYWQSREMMVEQMMRCQAAADGILQQVQRHLRIAST